MADHPAVQQAVAKALSEALGTIQRQLGEVQGSFEQVKEVLSQAGEGSSPDRFVALLPPLMHMQASGAALAASIETVLRFVGISAQWSGVPAMATPAVAAEPAYSREAEVAEAAPEAPAAVEEPVVEEPVAAEEEVVAPVEPPPAVEEPVEEAPAPAAVPAAPAPVDIDSLPDDLKELHKKAKRFAKVTVQDLAMYKKAEIAKGLENRDLYKRLKDEIDRSKATYDKRFDKIAGHNVDYLYDEIVRVLTKDDPGALGDYPYPTPGRQ
jgi:hypothetical protein